MKPTQIESQRTADAVVEALEVLGVAPGDAEVYLLEKGVDSDDAAMMLATPIGVLIMTHRLSSRQDSAWRLTTEVIPWKEISAKVIVHTDHSSRFEGVAFRVGCHAVWAQTPPDQRDQCRGQVSERGRGVRSGGTFLDEHRSLDG